MRGEVRLFLAGLFLMCMCVLMLQIAETRLLSVIAWYYLAFFAISMAMFGMTAGSLLVYFKAKLFDPRRLFEHLTWIATAFAVTVVLSTLSVVSSLLLAEIPSGIAALLWLRLILAILPPYVLAGMAISLALTRSRWPVGLVYGVDLLGAASGCLLVLGLLTWMDGVSALFAIGAIGAVSAACFRAAWRRSDDAVIAEAAATGWYQVRRPELLAVALAALAVFNAAIQPRGFAPVMVKNELEVALPAAQEWNSFSRVRAEEEESGEPAMWGPSATMPKFDVRQHKLNIDGKAGTALYAFGGDLATLGFLRYDVTNLAYAIRHTGRSAVIGVGGGRDLLSAHLYGFADVTGVELNPIFIDWLTGRFRDYNHLADLPGTHFVVDEARSWFARTTERFDLIEMSLIDTWAATGAGAFSLSENGLYTVEGWRHFIDALAPNGMLTVSRWYNPNNVSEAGRLVSLAVATLRGRGSTHPRAQIFLASAPILATIIVANAPFTADELAALHKATGELGFSELISPDRPVASPVLEQLLQAGSASELAALTAEHHIDFSAPTDDRPFFFNQLMWTDWASIRDALAAEQGVIHGNLQASKTIVIIVLLSAILALATMILPSLPAARRTTARLAWLGTTYFALTGLGFMFIEIGIIQRVSLFLGHPVYGLAVGLFSIILSTGIGSLLSERWRLDAPGKLIGWATALSVVVVLLTFWFPVLVAAFEGHGLAVRVLVSLVAIVPSGVLMGFGFPTGMRLVNAIDTRPTPWFWAVNGAAGVLAASVAVAVSIAFSINASLWIGAACYLLLGPVSLLLHRSARGIAILAASAVPARR
jgi:SAM-dependent methyltransferase